MAPHRRGRDRRRLGSDRPDDNREQDPRAGRAGRDFGEKRRPNESRERDTATKSDSRPAGHACRAKHDFGTVRDRSDSREADRTPDANASGIKVARPREKKKALEFDDAMKDPYLRGLYDKQYGKADVQSKERLRGKFLGLTEKTVEQTKESTPEHDSEKIREDTKRVEHAKASDAIRKVMEHYVPGEGGARESFTKYQYNTMEQLGDLSETMSKLDIGRALKVRNRTEDLVKSLKEGEDPVTALRQFQMNRIVDRQTAMMDVGRLTGKALGRLTDTSLSHQDGYTGASSAVMEAYRQIEKDVLASSPLKTDQPTTTDFSHIPSRETFNLRLAENHAEARDTVQVANEAEQGKLKKLGVISSVGLGCGFVYERDEGSIHSIKSWHGAFMVSRQNASAVSSQEFSRPAVMNYVRIGEGEGARMYLDRVAVLGDRAWQDLRSGKTYEDLYAETKGMSAQDVAGRLLPFASGGANNRFSIYGRSGPLELNMKAVYQMTTGTEDMMVRDINRFTVSPEELRKSGVMRAFSAEELGYGGKYLAQTRFQTGNFLTDFTTGSWTIASMLGRSPELVAERRLTGLRDSQGVEHDAGSVREELERLRFAPKLRAQRLGELFRNAQSVGFETIRPVTVRDPLAGLVIDRATESLAGPLTEVYKNSREIGEELARGETVGLEKAAFQALSTLRMSPRGIGVAKSQEATSTAEVNIGRESFRAEMRESKTAEGRDKSVGNYAWVKVEQPTAMDSTEASMKRTYDGPLSLKDKFGNPEVFVHLPSAYTRAEGISGGLYDCLEHIRQAPEGSVKEFPVGASTLRVKGHNKRDYEKVFAEMMRHEMKLSGATTEEARAKWLENHVDPVRAIGILGSVAVASKIATMPQGRSEAFTEFGASLSVDSTVVRGSPENLSGRLHSAGVMAGEARLVAERAATAEGFQGSQTSKSQATPAFDVVEAKKQSSPRTDSFTGHDGKFRFVFSEGSGGETETPVEVWTRSVGAHRAGFVSEETILPTGDGKTIRIGIGHSFPNLPGASEALRKGRPLEDVFNAIEGFGVRAVFTPTSEKELSGSTHEEKTNQ